MIDTTDTHSSQHPANRIELALNEMFEYMVNIDDRSETFCFDDLTDAEAKVAEILTGDEFEFESISIDVWDKINLKTDRTLREYKASDLFRLMKSLVIKIKTIKTFPMPPTSDEEQTLRECEELLFNFVRNV